MATCSGGDSFYLDVDWGWEGFPTFDGCYSDSGLAMNWQTVFFRGGDMVGGEPAVISADAYGTGVSWDIRNIHFRTSWRSNCLSYSLLMILWIYNRTVAFLFQAR